MKIAEAKEVLQLYRPGCGDSSDRKVAEALALVAREPDLATWLQEHNQFQTAVSNKLREIPVPPDLKDRILQQRKIVRPPAWWRDSHFLKVAATIVLFVGLTVLVGGIIDRSRTADRFADYESRMVRSALREYRMDLLTDDLAQLRRLAADKGAPSDFIIPRGLSQLSLTGGGVLRWRNNPVSMICFNRGDNEMLFLFVINRAAVKNPPSPSPELAKVSKLAAVSWTEGENAYLLAGPDEAKFIDKYF